jgi:hypothetical protein
MVNALDKFPYEVYPSLIEKRKVLEDYRENIIRLGHSKMEKIGDSIDYTDFVLLGIIQRSIELTKGFINLMDQWNLLCAAPLIRLHLDTLLRLAYISSLNDPEDISKRIFYDERINNIRDGEGKKLNDARLRDYARKSFHWIDEVYMNTSKFIHFSDKHIFSSIIKMNEKDHVAYFVIGNGTKNAKEEDLLSYYDIMIQINTGILHLITEICNKK